MSLALRGIQASSTFRKVTINSLFWSQKRSTESSASRASSANAPKNVPGLSNACILPASGEVGPGASKSGSYKNPEYFCYHSLSYFEAEIEMAKYRLPQPSSKRPAQ